MFAGYICDADGPELQGPPPVLGEHTRTVLRSLGYADSAIDAMISAGAAAGA